MDSFIGEIRVFSFPFPPQGWAFCNGSLLQIQQYPALYAVIGNQYGGQPQAGTFALPNLQAQVPAGYGQGAGLTEYTLGEQVGQAAVALISGQGAAHTHATYAMQTLATDSSPKAAGTGMLGYPNVNKTESWNLYQPYAQAQLVPLNPGFVTPAPGGTAAHENRQPFLTMNFCICLEGEYPPRP